MVAANDSRALDCGLRLAAEMPEHYGGNAGTSKEELQKHYIGVSLAETSKEVFQEHYIVVSLAVTSKEEL
ncbi:hypothetical protein [Paenibacillus montanisoli]|uniref:Uncharacterized protein n=1 Tax=Paenibacillus montanisoli TaxID=2081970 RepID=A0A328TUD6_9BACL|nr:hypothetical protein [Paenibacillus montanisoli]RAP74159.1 hypothetical protein DL346_24135 [Paenibacillus montanisoli]